MLFRTGFQSSSKKWEDLISQQCTHQQPLGSFNEKNYYSAFHLNSNRSTVYLLLSRLWSLTDAPGLASAGREKDGVKTSSNTAWMVRLVRRAFAKMDDVPPQQKLIKLRDGWGRWVVAEPPLFMTLGVRVAPDAALLCLDHRRLQSLRVGKRLKLKNQEAVPANKAT